MISIHRIGIVGLGVAASVLAGSARAGIVSTNGIVNAGQAPASLKRGVVGDPSARVYAERTNAVLSSNVIVNATAPGFYTESAGSFTVPAGSLVDSYIIHFDRVNGSGGGTTTGSITFSAPILGIIGTLSDLEASDSTAGAPGTAYETSFGRQFWDNPSQDVDTVTISADRRTLDFYFYVADTSVDDVRILVPEPSTALLATGGLLAMGMRCRRRMMPE